MIRSVMLDGSTDQSPDQNAARALTTYRNYLIALSRFMDRTYQGTGGPTQQAAIAQRKLRGYGQLRRKPGRHTGVRELLFNAWHTEIALALPSVHSDPGLIRFTNQWAPVQAYYAVYSLWRAWFLVNGTRVRSHTETLRSVSSAVRERSLFPPPWSYACSGGYRLSESTHIGFGSDPISDVKSLSTPGSLLPSDDWVAKTLRTTRRFFLDQREDDWKSENRTKDGRPYRRIPPAERKRIRKQLHPTTLFDFFYRIRIRSNYRDVDDFISGQLQDIDAIRYFECLINFTRGTMLLIESLVRATMPAGSFELHARQFLSSATRAKYSGLAGRLQAMGRADAELTAKFDSM